MTDAVRKVLGIGAPRVEIVEADKEKTVVKVFHGLDMGGPQYNVTNMSVLSCLPVYAEISAVVALTGVTAHQISEWVAAGDVRAKKLGQARKNKAIYRVSDVLENIEKLPDLKDVNSSLIRKAAELEAEGGADVFNTETQGHGDTEEGGGDEE
jgi:hypothetical protein